jgi:hypothetical protein
MSGLASPNGHSYENTGGGSGGLLSAAQVGGPQPHVVRMLDMIGNNGPQGPGGPGGPNGLFSNGPSNGQGLNMNMKDSSPSGNDCSYCN